MQINEKGDAEETNERVLIIAGDHAQLSQPKRSHYHATLRQVFLIRITCIISFTCS